MRDGPCRHLPNDIHVQIQVQVVQLKQITEVWRGCCRGHVPCHDMYAEKGSHGGRRMSPHPGNRQGAAPANGCTTIRCSLNGKCCVSASGGGNRATELQALHLQLCPQSRKFPPWIGSSVQAYSSLHLAALVLLTLGELPKWG